MALGGGVKSYSRNATVVLRLGWGFDNYSQFKCLSSTLYKRVPSAYPIVCCVSRLKRKQEVKSLMFSTHATWSEGRVDTRSPTVKHTQLVLLISTTRILKVLRPRIPERQN